MISIIKSDFEKYLDINSIERLTRGYFNHLEGLLKQYDPQRDSKGFNFIYQSEFDRLSRMSQRKLDSKNNILFLEVDNDRPIGYLLSSSVNHVWSLGPAFLEKEYRGKGLTKIVYNELQEEIKNRNGKRITVCINGNNLPVINLCCREKFKLDGMIFKTAEEILSLGEKRSLISMEKEL